MSTRMPESPMLDHPGFGECPPLLTANLIWLLDIMPRVLETSSAEVGWMMQYGSEMQVSDLSQCQLGDLACWNGKLIESRHQHASGRCRPFPYPLTPFCLPVLCDSRAVQRLRVHLGRAQGGHGICACLLHLTRPLQSVDLPQSISNGALDIVHRGCDRRGDRRGEQSPGQYAGLHNGTLTIRPKRNRDRTKEDKANPRERFVQRCWLAKAVNVAASRVQDRAVKAVGLKSASGRACMPSSL